MGSVTATGTDAAAARNGNLLKAQFVRFSVLIVDELGCPLVAKRCLAAVPSLSQRYEPDTTAVTSALTVQEWNSTFAGWCLDRVTQHVHILERNGESYPLSQSRS